MNKKLAFAAAVITLAGALATAPAEAQRRYNRGGSAAAAGIAGFAAGALLGGVIAQPRYGYGAGYYEQGYAYVPGPSYGPDDTEAYCMQRFKSYDPRSGTYLGYDGYRHPCP